MKTNQSEIARQAGISNSFFSLILSGERNAPYFTAVKIAGVVGCNPTLFCRFFGTAEQRQAAVAEYIQRVSET